MVPGLQSMGPGGPAQRGLCSESGFNAGLGPARAWHLPGEPALRTCFREKGSAHTARTHTDKVGQGANGCRKQSRAGQG